MESCSRREIRTASWRMRQLSRSCDDQLHNRRDHAEPGVLRACACESIRASRCGAHRVISAAGIGDCRISQFKRRLDCSRRFELIHFNEPVCGQSGEIVVHDNASSRSGRDFYLELSLHRNNNATDSTSTPYLPGSTFTPSSRLRESCSRSTFAMRIISPPPPRPAAGSSQ